MSDQEPVAHPEVVAAPLADDHESVVPTTEERDTPTVQEEQTGESESPETKPTETKSADNKSLARTRKKGRARGKRRSSEAFRKWMKARAPPVAIAKERTEKSKVKMSWRGHSASTPYTLPVTDELLKKNVLDGEVPANPLGEMLKPRTKRRSAKRAVDAPTNWGALEGMLEERKEEVKAPSRVVETREWFEMPHVSLTDEMKRDVRIIENRQHLDPKRFYKSAGTGRRKGELPTQVQFGTLVEAPHEFYSSRLTKRERRSTIAEEVMADDRIMAFTKRRNKEIQKQATRPRRIIDPAAKKKRR